MTAGYLLFLILFICWGTSVFLWAFLQNPLDLYRTGLEISHPRGLIYASFAAGFALSLYLAGRVIASRWVYAYAASALAAAVWSWSCSAAVFSAVAAAFWIAAFVLFQLGVFVKRGSAD
ncbi:hypothetical protein IJT93_11250 [bacterium]|nr:hypothetical protein [bacterium]